MEQRLNKWKNAFRKLLSNYEATENHKEAIDRYLAHLAWKFVVEQDVEVCVCA
jgi:hypothetical protein